MASDVCSLSQFLINFVTDVALLQERYFDFELRFLVKRDNRGEYNSYFNVNRVFATFCVGKILFFCAKTCETNFRLFSPCLPVFHFHAGDFWPDLPVFQPEKGKSSRFPTPLEEACTPLCNGAAVLTIEASHSGH